MANVSDLIDAGKGFIPVIQDIFKIWTKGFIPVIQDIFKIWTTGGGTGDIPIGPSTSFRSFWLRRTKQPTIPTEPSG